MNWALTNTSDFYSSQSLFSSSSDDSQTCGRYLRTKSIMAATSELLTNGWIFPPVPPPAPPSSFDGVLLAFFCRSSMLSFCVGLKTNRPLLISSRKLRPTLLLAGAPLLAAAVDVKLLAVVADRDEFDDDDVVVGSGSTSGTGRRLGGGGGGRGGAGAAVATTAATWTFDTDKLEAVVVVVECKRSMGGGGGGKGMSLSLSWSWWLRWWWWLNATLGWWLLYKPPLE